MNRLFTTTRNLCSKRIGSSSIRSFTNNVKSTSLPLGVKVEKYSARKKLPDEPVQKHTELKETCGTPNDDDLDEMEEMFILGPAGMEWNGPTRGGARPEPTRYGDWERKGRCSDF